MACYHPLEAWSIHRPGEKNEITFNPSRRAEGTPLKLPCGQCVGCRLERSRQWAIRCMHEASLYRDNCFITLTYDNAHLPADGSLDLRHWQLFMKRLRKKYGENIRFYHCGEYGERYRRPHYHAILFNFDFPDKYPWKRTGQGHQTWRSPSLEDLWPLGLSEIGSVSFESAAYVARYIMKKITGPAADDYYTAVHPVTGEVFSLKPEYVTMSRRPGIAHGWFQKFAGDVYPSDSVILKGREMRPPRYYDRLLELTDPQELELIKFQRSETAKKYLDDNSPDRMLVKEQCTVAKLSRLKRDLS